MAATPKSRGSKSRRDRKRSQPRHKAKKIQLTKLPSGKMVPTHMVTPENPTKNGIRFLRAPKKKK